MTIFLFSRILRVLKWDLFFNERRGVNTTGHSLSTGGESSEHSLTNWPTSSLMTYDWLTAKLLLVFDSTVILYFAIWRLWETSDSWSTHYVLTHCYIAAGPRQHSHAADLLGISSWLLDAWRLQGLRQLPDCCVRVLSCGYVYRGDSE
jgi:hypothetical protein